MRPCDRARRLCRQSRPGRHDPQPPGVHAARDCEYGRDGAASVTGLQLPNSRWGKSRAARTLSSSI